MVLKNSSKFVSIHLTKWYQEKKYIRGNNMPLFNKELSSTHKERTQLRNRYLKKRSYQNKKLYTKQQNFYISLLRKTKKSTMPI